jgi:photosystem II stability/assembly factor-like uncharacterized protein
MNIRRWMFLCMLLFGTTLTGCGSSAEKPPILFGEDPPGKWEQVADFSYYDVPAADLKGTIGPAYLVYMVTLAGFHDTNFGMTIGPDDDVRYTVDGGTTWAKSEGELHCRHGLDIVDRKVAWHCGNGGTRMSADGGLTWTTTAPSPCPSLSFLDARTGWAASPYELRATADGGSSWPHLNPPVGENLIAAVALTPAGAGYALDQSGNLHVTADGGGTWETRSIGLENGARLVPSFDGPRAALRFVDERHAILVYDLEDRSVWFAVTRDGGSTWRHEEIVELRNRSTYYYPFLSRDGTLLTVTDNFNSGKNVSILFRYVPE